MNKKTITTAGIIIIAVLLLGYFLSRSSPQASVQNPDILDNMHNGQSSASVDYAQLNSLVGKPLPNIELVDKNSKKYTNESLKGKNTVLFFSEGLMCYPACWNQIAQFGSDPRFTTDKIQVFSVLADSSNDWQKAIEKMPELAKANTLFDIGAVVSRKLGLLTLPSSMHRGSLPGHTYIVLDKEGVVRYINDDPNMAIWNDMLISKMSGFGN